MAEFDEYHLITALARYDVEKELKKGGCPLNYLPSLNVAQKAKVIKKFDELLKWIAPLVEHKSNLAGVLFHNKRTEWKNTLLLQQINKEKDRATKRVSNNV